jgi:hypothetical protein
MSFSETAQSARGVEQSVNSVETTELNYSDTSRGTYSNQNSARDLRMN